LLNPCAKKKGQMVEEGSIYKLMLEESSAYKLLIAFLLTDVFVHNCEGGGEVVDMESS
jgi:hypothetical protein